MTADSAWSLEPKLILRDADAIITHIEVCGRHGVGRLVQMLFDGEPSILSIRSANLYEGRQEFGGLDLCISHQDKSRDAVFCRVLDAVGQNTVKRILCIPYFADDGAHCPGPQRDLRRSTVHVHHGRSECGARTESRTI